MGYCEQTSPLSSSFHHCLFIHVLLLDLIIDALAHLQLYIGQEEDRRQWRGGPQDGHSRAGVVDPLVELVEECTADEGAKEDSDDLKQEFTVRQR